MHDLLEVLPLDFMKPGEDPSGSDSYVWVLNLCAPLPHTMTQLSATATSPRKPSWISPSLHRTMSALLTQF